MTPRLTNFEAFEVYLLNGAQASEIDYVNPTTYALGPLQQVTLRIVFTPQAVGEHVGALDLTHNDGDVRSPLRVDLWGVGATGEPKRYYYFKDHLGSVRATVNDDGNVVDSRDYYPFGMDLADRGVTGGDEAPKERYTGHELDEETDLYYAGARYLDPVVGRWLAVDPLADRFPAHSSYNYVLNNPLSLTDPDGRAPSCCFGPLVFNPRFGLGTLNTIGTTLQALFDPRNIAQGRQDISEGSSKVVNGFRTGNLDEGTEGVQQMVDGVGTVAGMLENYATLVTVSAVAGGQPQIALPAKGIAELTGLVSSGADVAGFIIEVANIVSERGHASPEEAVTRLLTIIVNSSDIHIRQDQLEAIAKSLGIDLSSDLIEGVGEDDNSADSGGTQDDEDENGG